MEFPLRPPSFFPIYSSILFFKDHKDRLLPLPIFFNNDFAKQKSSPKDEKTQLLIIESHTWAKLNVRIAIVNGVSIFFYIVNQVHFFYYQSEELKKLWCNETF